MFYRVIRVIVSVVERISVLLLLLYLDLLLFRSALRFTGRRAERTITGGKMEGGGFLCGPSQFGGLLGPFVLHEERSGKEGGRRKREYWRYWQYLP